MIANKKLISVITTDTKVEQLSKLFYKDTSIDDVDCYTLDGNFKIKLLINGKHFSTLYATKINYYSKLHYIELWKLGELIATITPTYDVKVEVYQFID